MTVHARSLRAHQIPKGTPNKMQKVIAVVISDSVVIASDHTPRAAIAKYANTPKAATPSPANLQNRRNVASTSTGNGTDWSAYSLKVSRRSTGHLIVRNIGRKCKAIHCTAAWIHSAMGK